MDKINFPWFLGADLMATNFLVSSESFALVFYDSRLYIRMGYYDIRLLKLKASSYRPDYYEVWIR